MRSRSRSWSQGHVKDRARHDPRGRPYSRDMSQVTGATPAPPTPPARRPSLAPLVVVAVFFVVIITLVLIGAQRSAEPAPSIAIARPGTPDQPRPVTVLMRDYLFDPTPLVLVAGETIRLTVFSAGMTSHELVLGDRAVQDAWALADAAATPPAPFTTAPPASVAPGTGGVRLLLPSGAERHRRLHRPRVRRAVPALPPAGAHRQGHDRPRGAARRRAVPSPRCPRSNMGSAVSPGSTPRTCPTQRSRHVACGAISRRWIE